MTSASGDDQPGDITITPARPPVTLTPLRWWHLEQVDAIERALFGVEAWSVGLFWSELSLPDSRYYLVAMDRVGAGQGAAPDTVVGYAGLCAYPGDGYIQTIAVRRDCQGQGIGAGLLLALLRESVRRGPDTIWLEVRSDNPGAQRLYARFGFTPAGIRRGYYQPSGTDAVVMVVRDLRRRLAAADPGTSA